MITQQPAPETEQPEDTPPPDVHHTSQDPFCSDLEGQRGLSMPVELFAIIESALRYDRGLDVETHRDRVARLYSAFSEIAAANPHAWRREPMRAEEIRDATAKNAMLAFPYTKRHCTPVERQPGRRDPGLLGARGRAARPRPRGAGSFRWPPPSRSMSWSWRSSDDSTATPGRCCAASAPWRWPASDRGPDGRRALQLLPGRHPVVRPRSAPGGRVPADGHRRHAVRRRPLQPLQPRGRGADGRGVARGAAPGRRAGLVAESQRHLRQAGAACCCRPCPTPPATATRTSPRAPPSRIRRCHSTATTSGRRRSSATPSSSSATSRRMPSPSATPPAARARWCAATTARCWRR